MLTQRGRLSSDLAVDSTICDDPQIAESASATKRTIAEPVRRQPLPSEAAALLATRGTSSPSTIGDANFRFRSWFYSVAMISWMAARALSRSLFLTGFTT